MSAMSAAAVMLALRRVTPVRLPRRRGFASMPSCNSILAHANAVQRAAEIGRLLEAARSLAARPDAAASGEVAAFLAHNVVEADMGDAPVFDIPPPPPGGGPRAPRNVAMLHSLANIEFHAIGLYLHTAGMAAGVASHLASSSAGLTFFIDCAAVAADEALHLLWLEARMEALAPGTRYGSLPVHTGLWADGRATQGDVIGRLAVLPMVLEARALDSDARLVGKFTSWGDAGSAELVARIIREEVGHVAVGLKWFHALTAAQVPPMDPVAAFHEKVRRYMGGNRLPPPFNHPARAAAGMSPDWYEPLTMLPKPRPMQQREAKPAAASAARKASAKLQAGVASAVAAAGST